MTRIEHGDMLEVVPRLAAEGVQVDSIVTDPPYHLGPQKTQEIGWPSWTAHTKEMRAGFMRQQWDGGDIAFCPETWAAMLPVLRPGGYMLVFGGARTHHRIWCAVEDAGFVVQDTVMWLYGSGFPKGHTQLKPAFEPICVAYKPGRRTLQIDECRIDGAGPSGLKPYIRSTTPNVYAMGKDKAGKPVTYEDHPGGRWPANVVHDGSAEVLEAFAEFGEYGGDQRGECDGRRPGGFGDVGAANGDPTPNARVYSDTGSAARFYYTAKASSVERRGGTHPTVKPLELMAWLVALVTPIGGTVLDPFAGSGTTGVAALATGREAILIEREAAYLATLRRRLAAVARLPGFGGVAKATAPPPLVGPSRWPGF